MKIITKVQIIHEDEIIDVAKFVRNDDGHLEEMCAFVREPLE